MRSIKNLSVSFSLGQLKRTFCVPEAGCVLCLQYWFWFFSLDIISGELRGEREVRTDGGDVEAGEKGTLDNEEANVPNESDLLTVCLLFLDVEAKGELGQDWETESEMTCSCPPTNCFMHSNLRILPDDVLQMVRGLISVIHAISKPCSSAMTDLIDAKTSVSTIQASLISATTITPTPSEE
ncbi:hypothetical protein L7F22_028193 [Adiantum nelumboides]|nr:hypothetical protein [Adiantum nelumboides]